MKKIIISIIVVFAGLLAWTPAAFAQEGGVRSNKTISGPDDNGIYTISLEAYVTGSKVTTETLAPTDIVLCLAYNNGIDDKATLRKAVANFIQIIQAKDVIKDADGNPTGEHVGYRVAVDLYGPNKLPANASYYNTLYDVNSYEATVTTNDGSLKYNGSELFPRDNAATGNEHSDAGMDRAESIIVNRPEAEQDRASTVVFFTNRHAGPQGNNHWNSNDNTAAMSCINSAYVLKQHNSNVVAVGLHDTESADYVTNWLWLTSSDNLPGSDGTTDATYPGNPLHYVTGKNSILADVNELVGIFAGIASSIGGDYNIGSASSVLIDVVSTSFTVSTDADLGQAKVWRVPCNDSGPGLIQHSFNDAARVQFDVVEDQEELDAITDTETRNKTVYMTVDETTGKVTVSGFDYGANWCGWESNTTTGEAGPHGYKLVLEIPITANTDAVGGPAVQTNAEGSGLYLRDSEGNLVGDPITFISPVVSLPVNIHITKTGLKKGESAKFMIERAAFDKSSTPSPEEYGGLDWKYVSTVFVTNDGHETITKVRGLPAEGEEEGVRVGFLYRISEEGWSWSYIPDPESENHGPMFTDTNHVDNPFTFDNVPKDNIDVKVRHAESKVMNVFKAGGGPVYVDSKDNGR